MELPPNNIRAIPELSKFKLAISDLKFDADCYTSVVNLLKFYLNYSVHQYFFNPAFCSNTIDIYFLKIII